MKEGFMFTKKEFTWMIIIIIIFEFILALKTKGDFLILDISSPWKFIVPPLIIFTSVIAKKIASKYFCIKIEHSLWKFKRFGYYLRSYLKKPFPIGLILPFALAFLSLGYVKPLTFLQFDYEDYKERRLMRMHGDYQARRYEINETDPGLTAWWGFFSLIVLSVIGIFLNFKELALWPLYYNFWNMIPLENLDGMKCFFGNFFTYLVIVALNLIMLIIALLVFV